MIDVISKLGNIKFWNHSFAIHFHWNQKTDTAKIRGNCEFQRGTNVALTARNINDVLKRDTANELTMRFALTNFAVEIVTWQMNLENDVSLRWLNKL